jgi:PAS domain S-box-containing protein
MGKFLRRGLTELRLNEQILKNIPGGLLTTNRKGSINTFNQAAEAILGYPAREVLGQPLEQLLDLRTVLSCAQTLKETSSYDQDVSGDLRGVMLASTHAEGYQLLLQADILPLRDEAGRQIGLLITFNDVTMMRLLEEEQRRLDRLALLGEMAAGMAHEVRNPLACIKTSMQMLKVEWPETADEEVQESIEVVLKEVERLDTIVRDLLLFARPARLQRVRCNLPELCDRVLRLLQRQCSEACVLVQRVYEPLPPLWLDVAQLEQVLLNLCINAIQAMSEGGMLTVACRCINSECALNEDPRSEVSYSPVPVSVAGMMSEGANRPPVSSAAISIPRSRIWTSNPGQQEETHWIELAVGDSGPGIAPEHVERIFQPFFTTKAHGIGLGLSITRRLVEDHQGYLRVEGRVGYGTTMLVRLPVVQVEEVI